MDHKASFLKIAQAGGGGANLGSFFFLFIFSRWSSALDHSATAPPFIEHLYIFILVRAEIANLEAKAAKTIVRSIWLFILIVSKQDGGWKGQFYFDRRWKIAIVAKMKVFTKLMLVFKGSRLSGRVVRATCKPVTQMVLLVN